MEASEGDQGGWFGDWFGRMVRERWSGRVVGQDSWKLVRGLVLEVGRGEWSVMGSSRKVVLGLGKYVCVMEGGRRPYFCPKGKSCPQGLAARDRP